MDSDNQPRWRAVHTIPGGWSVEGPNDFVLEVRYQAEANEAASYLNSLETDLAALRGLVEELQAQLKYFVRWEHRRQFPHVRPTKAEAKADEVLDRAAKLLTGGKDD